MLTRLEVDGFKNLLGFACDFGPYTCIAGPNAVGKSNLYDAIEWLSRLAERPFAEAAPDPAALFWNRGESADPVMRLAAEMIVPDEVEDDFGRSARTTSTFLRYELTLRLDRDDRPAPSPGAIRLVSEALSYIPESEALGRLPWPHSPRAFRDAVIHNARRSRSQYYISTSASDDGTQVAIHQDAGSRGQPLPWDPARATRTVVSTITSAADPTILAARREMAAWRRYALEPAALRQPDEAHATPHLTPAGAHLPATLARLAREQGERVLQTVAATTAALTDLRSLTVDHDPARGRLTLAALVGSGPVLPAGSLSDGTLRYLALAVLAADPGSGRLLCLDTPENGIHPARLKALVELTRRLAVDPGSAPGPDNPLRQVIVTTHSPRFVRCVAERHPGDVLAAETATVPYAGSPTPALRLHPMAGTWRARADAPRPLPGWSFIDYDLGVSDTLIADPVD